MPHRIQIHEPCATFRRCRCPCAIKQCQCSMFIMSKKGNRKRNQRQPHGSALLSPQNVQTKEKKRGKNKKHQKPWSQGKEDNPTKILTKDKKKHPKKSHKPHVTPVPSNQTNPKPQKDQQWPGPILTTQLTLVVSSDLQRPNCSGTHTTKELGQIRSALMQEEVPSPALMAMGSLYNLSGQNLAGVLEAGALK